MNPVQVGTDEDHIYELIRRSGGKVTFSTRTVLAILLAADEHLTADDIITEAERRTPGIAVSTVYRVLQRLEDLGAVEHIHSGHGPTFYHLGAMGHAHLVCSDCGSITDIPEGVLSKAADRIHREYDFTVQVRHTALIGRCAACVRR